MEDLDALAGTIAFEHCRVPRERDLLLVTASVDRIVYSHRPNLKDDILLSGSVSWVGRSSMEINMKACSTWTDQPFLDANFSFVARDPDTGRSAPINPLRVSGEVEEAKFALAKERDAVRKEMRRAARESVVGVALDEELMASAHDLLKQSKTLLTMPSLADPHDILLEETKLENTFLTQPQQRNTAGRIFGGFLMRRAFELAFSTAYLFAGRRPIFFELDEVTFKNPVSVGDLLQMESCVLYTSEAMDIRGRATVHVEVLAHVCKPEQRASVTSNTFNFTFGVAGDDGAALHGSEVDLRRVVPATHDEAYRIMERYKGDIQQREEDERAN